MVTLGELGLALTILVTIGIVVAIVLFERPRARQIEEDLRRDAEHRRDDES